ncbi:MAG: lysophospholipase [Candidatus Obscuribacterales bacterium]|nr:lysophospholipase [Candidatus Obscuribacterales bacterium]
MKAPKLILLSLAITLSLASNLAQAKAADDVQIDGMQIAQLMQMDCREVTKLETEDVLEAPVKKSGKMIAAKLDATPVISWVDPDVKLKAVLVCVHGLGLHKENYKELGERIAKEGYGVYSMDVRGFGEFQHMPGDTVPVERKCDFVKCLDDVCEGLKVARAMHPGVPVFVLGESMGGAIAMRVTEEHPELMDGLISSVPGAKRYGQGKSALHVGLKLLTGGTNAKVDVSKSVVSQSTQKESLKEEWSNDKLARFTLSPVELIQFQHFMESNEKNASKITTTPVLMVQGDADRLVRQDDNQAIIERIPSKDSQLVFVHGGEHLIFEEGQFDESAVKMLCSWIDEHSKKLSATK